jgi:hypothetical protein
MSWDGQQHTTTWESISPQLARSLLTDTGWQQVNNNKQWPSRSGKWLIQQVDTNQKKYERQPIN